MYLFEYINMITDKRSYPTKAQFEKRMGFTTGTISVTLIKIILVVHKFLKLENGMNQVAYFRTL